MGRKHALALFLDYLLTNLLNDLRIQLVLQLRRALLLVPVKSGWF